MYVALTKPLFAWDCLQDNPSLGSVLICPEKSRLSRKIYAPPLWGRFVWLDR